jgi:uncharacterized protein (TIGR00730 family)
MPSFSSWCVFCGSQRGNDPVYQQAASELGRYFAQHRVRLVYGAANCGLMADVADAVLTGGGDVVGVIPRIIDRMDLTHARLTHLHRVDTMHERKALMAELSDGFIALPGGIGTFDELCEMVCWSQLGIHHKPIGILNTAGYYDGFLQFLQHAVQHGFMKPTDMERIQVEKSVPALMKRLRIGHERVDNIY